MLALTIVPVLFVLIGLFNKKIVDVATEVRDTESRVYSLVQWAMSSIKVVQAFTKEEEEHRRFMGASRESLRATLRLYSWQTLYSGAVNVVIAGGTALVVYAGARAVISGGLTVGQLIVFIAYLAQLYAPINQITQSWGLIAGARIGARRVFEVLDTEPDLEDGHRSFPPTGARGAVAWRGVGFRYRPETPVLTSIDLEVPAGRQDRHRRPDRRRQIDAAWPLAALFRSVGGDGRDRRRRCARISPEIAAQPDRHGAAAAADLSTLGARQHRLRPPRRRATQRSSRRRGWRGSTIWSPRSPRATTPSSANRACRCRKGRSSA